VEKPYDWNMLQMFEKQHLNKVKEGGSSKRGGKNRILMGILNKWCYRSWIIV
jgi:hypothetical protein